MSSTGGGVPNQRRINQTIDVGAALEHLDIEMPIANQTPNELSTLQPMDVTSPTGNLKIQANPNMIIPISGPAPVKGNVNNFMVQRQSPFGNKHENNFMVPGLQKPNATSSGAPQPTFKNKKAVRA